MPAVARWFRTIAIVEAVTWAALLVAMFLKYVVKTPYEGGVPVVGMLHGIAFVVYCVSTLVAATTLRWRWWVWPLAFAAAIPPLATIAFERWAGRRGLLHRDPARTVFGDRALARQG
ncbi:DUF3817 domain-containing protein [Kineococcus gynurae]|uniref:DUF3817 domain-containing protein n=1 Tax=Kineococcus gynurae TaxID=452979 RepID=A0ABV5LPS1_9ACTN